MFQRKYTVKGEDVNDFMVMQNAAYLHYASKLLDTFLFINGFTTLKMNSQKVGLEKKNDNLVVYKPLFFTQEIYVNLILNDFTERSNKMNVTIDFYTNKNELSASLTRELFWLDYERWETITPPNKLIKQFRKETSFRKVG